MSQEENKSQDRGQTTENKPKVSKLAISSLVFVGIFAVCTIAWFVPSKTVRNKFADDIFIVGVISLILSFWSGVSAISKISLCKEKVRGTGFAAAGALISGSLLFVGFLLPTIINSPPKSSGYRMICGSNLKGLGYAIMAYANNYDNKFPAPDKWCDLLIKYADVVPKQFFCVSSDAQKGQSCYAINSNLAGKTIGEVSLDTVVLFETKGGWNQYGGREILTLENHEGKRGNILFFDGHVEWIKAENINKLKWEVNEVAIQLKTGDKAPGFSLLDQDSNEVKLTDFTGKKILLYFYPKADTPGCTTQACSARDSAEPLKELGVVTLGISPDDPNAQKKFDEKYSLGFRLLSDVNHKTAEAYGVWGEKVRDGKKTMGIIRSSFLIDEQGKIIQVWYNVSPADTVPNALAALKEK